MMSASVPVPSAAEDADGHHGDACVGDTRDARPVIRPARGDRGDVRSVTVRVGRGVGAVEAPALDQPPCEIGRTRVDAGVEHGERRGTRGVDHTVDVFPADGGKRPLRTVGRIGRAALGVADLVE